MPSPSPSFPLAALAPADRQALLAWVRERALVVREHNLKARVIGLGLLGFALVWMVAAGLLRGYGDPYHAAMRLDLAGWLMVGAGALCLPLLLRAWLRTRRAAILHGGTAGDFLLPEGLVQLRQGHFTFRSRSSLSRCWRWETVDQEGRWLRDDLHLVFRDGQTWDAPLEGRDFKAFQAAQRRGAKGPSLETLLDKIAAKPEASLPFLSRCSVRLGFSPALTLGLALGASLLLALLLPVLIGLRDRASDELAYQRALADANPFVWSCFESRTRLHRAEAQARSRAAEAAMNPQNREVAR